MNNQQILEDAINNKKNVEFYYDNERRECSPHAIGFNKDGGISVLVYQYGGNTSKGPVTGDSERNWRCMFASKIAEVKTIGGEWRTWENHTQRSSCIVTMIAEVDYSS